MFVLLFPGLVSYIVSVKGTVTAALKVTLMDKQGHCVASSNGPFGVLKVQDVKLWWPYLTHENPGYLYSMEVSQFSACWFAAPGNQGSTPGCFLFPSLLLCRSQGIRRKKLPS
uniref:Uncharacterized protein n=1 Tax=Oryzias latipes TaxID=8090 RepID=A0A3P9IR15_ORYLA